MKKEKEQAADIPGCPAAYPFTIFHFGRWPVTDVVPLVLSVPFVAGSTPAGYKPRGHTGR
ncbi:MAG: hypothetical protein ACQESR_06720 [Planctomycetota bacterium]